jgi:hypothetical protein
VNMRDLARVAMASRVLGDAAKEEGAAARAALGQQMLDAGVERVRVHNDDVDYGTVVCTPGRRSAAIVNDDAFTAWVAARYPDQMVMSVRPSFRELLVGRASRLGDPVDKETGEVIPGMAMRQGDPYLTVRPSSDAKERMKTSLASHGLLMLGWAEDGAA